MNSTNDKRINRHLAQRSEMLSGISHDLRTPLYKIKIAVSFDGQKDLAEKMTNDIDEMEMLSDYLQYAKSQAEEKLTKINLSNMITEILKNYDKNKYEFEKSEIIEIEGRENLIKRCIINIIGNGLAYGDKIKIQN